MNGEGNALGVNEGLLLGGELLHGEGTGRDEVDGKGEEGLEHLPLQHRRRIAAVRGSLASRRQGQPTTCNAASTGGRAVRQAPGRRRAGDGGACAHWRRRTGRSVWASAHLGGQRRTTHIRLRRWGISTTNPLVPEEEEPREPTGEGALPLGGGDIEELRLTSAAAPPAPGMERGGVAGTGRAPAAPPGLGNPGDEGEGEGEGEDTGEPPEGEPGVLTACRKRFATPPRAGMGTLLDAAGPAEEAEAGPPGELKGDDETKPPETGEAPTRDGTPGVGREGAGEAGAGPPAVPDDEVSGDGPRKEDPPEEDDETEEESADVGPPTVRGPMPLPLPPPPNEEGLAPVGPEPSAERKPRRKGRMSFMMEMTFEMVEYWNICSPNQFSGKAGRSEISDDRLRKSAMSVF